MTTAAIVLAYLAYGLNEQRRENCRLADMARDLRKPQVVQP